METIVFATNNKHKLEEVSKILHNYKIISLEEINCTEDIPETADTLHGNALIKAEYIYNKTGLNCFADDTGLEVEALNGEPGVYSARYAGEDHDATKNMKKLLEKMNGKENRNACFKTVIALIIDGDIQYFEGKIDGKITSEPRGKNGFGYDPVFIPEGYNKTFAELGDIEKNKISHRALAVQKLAEYLGK